MENKYPSFPKEEDKKTIENIIRQYPKTNDCELQTLGELRDWQIKELKKLMENNWISVKEKLPPPYGNGIENFSHHVLVCRPSTIVVAYYEFEDKEWVEAHGKDGQDPIFLNDVICWMPLPERPKE